MSQDVATTAGQSYTFEFDLSTYSAGGPESGDVWYLKAFFDGTEVGYYSSTSGHFAYQVTALDSNSTLMFASRNDPSSNRLDNVSLTSLTSNVPEPASLALLGMGLVGLAASRRRKLA